MSRKFTRTWRTVLATAAIALLAGSVVTTTVQASDKRMKRTTALRRPIRWSGVLRVTPS